jgi:hypothetical protein
MLIDVDWIGDYVDAPTTKIPCSNVKVEKLTYPQDPPSIALCAIKFWMQEFKKVQEFQ